jgi:conjugative transposon TraN protein
VIFPSPVRYVDLGSADIIAGKADGSENVIRVKAAIQGFERETNFSVITDEGSFHSFNVKYADEPEKLNIEMKDFIHDGEAVNRPNNSLDIYMQELGNESPKIVNLIMKSIYQSDKRQIKHIGSKRFGIQLLLKGIYTYNDFLYFHIQTKNASQVPFDMDFIRIKIVDKKAAKRTAIQEQVIYPVRAYRYNLQIPGKKSERTVFALPKFTIPDGKHLIVELFEKNGGRHQNFVVENEDITRARIINDLKLK